MKLCMSHIAIKAFFDAKFEADSSCSFGDMTSENLRGRREQVIKFGYLPPENGFNF